MNDVTIRIHFQDSNGTVEDGQQDFGLEDFAGFLPNIGDQILDPSTAAGADRSRFTNRRMWTVVGRVFNPRDLKNYVALIVSEKAVEIREEPFVS